MAEKYNSSVVKAVYTIGHSNVGLEAFLGLLDKHGIQVVADVRSNPVSRYAVHFDARPLREALAARGIGFEFLGDRLGGKPRSSAFYDDDGYVLYYRIAESEAFQEGMARLLVVSAESRTAVMCGEENPTDCHRRRLIGRVLAEKGIEVLHLRGDGRLMTEAEVAAAEDFKKTRGQMSLFEPEEEPEWKSTRSVSPKKAPPDFSGRSDNTGSDD